MQKKALLALMLALMLVLSSCALVVKDESVLNGREVIRVGETVYTRAEVQSQVDYSLSYMQYLYSQFGMSYDVTNPENIQQAQESIISALVEEAVQIEKAKALGLDQLTEEEKAELEENVQQEIVSSRDYLAEQYGLNAEQDAAVIDQLMASQGVTEDYVRSVTLNSLLLEKVKEYAKKDVTLTEEEVVAGFNAKVEAQKASFAGDLSGYGDARLNGGTIYYAPAGYRYTKQILIQMNEADTALIDEIQKALNEATTQAADQASALGSVANLDELLALVQVTMFPAETPTAEANVMAVSAGFPSDADPEVTAKVQALKETQAKRDFLAEQLIAAQDQALENIAPEADEVLAALDNGEDWDTLAAAHNDDPGMMAGAEFAETGYPICEGFASFDSAYVSAAMALTEVGTHTDKIPGSYGYYIIQYTADVAEGPVDLETVREALSESLLSDKQDAAYEEALSTWTNEADIKIDRKALN